MKKQTVEWSDYEVEIETDHSGYGDQATDEEALVYAIKMQGLVKEQFPGISVGIVAHLADAYVFGPDESKVETIQSWIEKAWDKVIK